MAKRKADRCPGERARRLKQNERSHRRRSDGRPPITTDHINLLVGITGVLLGLHFGLGVILAFLLGSLFYAAVSRCGGGL